MNSTFFNVQDRFLSAVVSQLGQPGSLHDGQEGMSMTMSTVAANNDVPLDLPASITSWLANLSLLYGVPFEYLVPDIRLLPVESIRFFYIDPNWLRRAIDGALSIGAMSSRDNLFNDRFYEAVYAAVQAAVPEVRSDLRGAPVPNSLLSGGTTTGFLFRSAVVSGYPGLEVVPTQSGQPVPILRLDRVSNDIMLALFAGVPDHIEIRQPPEGLHFGITRVPPPAPPTPAPPPSFDLYLRWVGHSGQPADETGSQIETSPNKYLQLNVAGLRTGAGQPDGVLDVAKTTGAIIQALGTAYLGPDKVFTSAEFAMEMVLSAGVQPYDVNPAAKP